jgi:urocanate hydratase
MKKMVEKIDYFTSRPESMAKHVAAMVGFMDRGAEVFDYGNSIRDRRKAGSDRADFPAVPACIRPQFEGPGPFRWVRCRAIRRTSPQHRAILSCSPTTSTHPVDQMAGEVAFQAARAHLLARYGERHLAGLKFNEMVASGELSAPHRDRPRPPRLRLGGPPYRGPRRCSTAPTRSPTGRRSTLVNTASGAHGVDTPRRRWSDGPPIHAGQVTVADGSDLAAQKLARVLTNDPGMGVIRHVDAGYEHAPRSPRAWRAYPMRENA